MKFNKRFFATTLFVVGSVVHPSIAFEGDEEPCPAFANQTSEFPSCVDCVSAGCGFVTDEGDCVKDCSTVPDSACFSTATNPDLDAPGICDAAASNSTTVPASEASSTTEETMCPESNGDTSTCELCVSAGCGWTADDGDCLLSCDEVNDGAACVSDVAACTSEVATEETMCPESNGDTSTCELCVSAGCGWTADDGDCLLSCDEVNDGAACVSDVAACTSEVATEETMCPESKGDTSTCELCVTAGCGWTADDGDCLLSCDEVNDGAACVSDTSGCVEEADKASEPSSARKPQIFKLLFVFIAASLCGIST